MRNSLKTIIDGQNSLRECISTIEKRQETEQYLGTSKGFQSSRISDVEKKLAVLEEQNSKMLEQIAKHNSDMRKFRGSRDNLERHSRRHYLLLCNYGTKIR